MRDENPKPLHRRYSGRVGLLGATRIIFTTREGFDVSTLVRKNSRTPKNCIFTGRLWNGGSSRFALTMLKSLPLVSQQCKPVQTNEVIAGTQKDGRIQSLSVQQSATHHCTAENVMVVLAMLIYVQKVVPHP